MTQEPTPPRATRALWSVVVDAAIKGQLQLVPLSWLVGKAFGVGVIGHHAAAVFGVAGEDAEVAHHVKPGWRNGCAEPDQLGVRLQIESMSAVLPDVFERGSLPSTSCLAYMLTPRAVATGSSGVAVSVFLLVVAPENRAQTSTSKRLPEQPRALPK